jgi:hypothetical protein
LHRDMGPTHNEGVDDVLKELAEHAEIVLQARATEEEHLAAIRELLPKARAANVKNGPGALERVIKGVYVRDTISRWTKDVAPPRGKKAREAAAATPRVGDSSSPLAES